VTSGAVPVAYLCLQATREGQGSYAHVHEIIGGLERRGYSIDLFEPQYARKNSVLPGAFGRAYEFRRIQKELMGRTSDAEIVYVRAHFAAGATARWARRRGIPVVQEVNGPYDDLFTAWPWTRHLKSYFVGLMREQYRSADALITVTDNLAAWLADETGRNDIAVIPNGANTELFSPDAAPPTGLPPRYVVFFGAFAAWQGLETLVAATNEPAWPEDVSLVIAGDGFKRDVVEEAAERSPRIHYIGTVPYPEVPGLVAGSIAGLSPQGYAGGRSKTGLSPQKVYETLACGVPVVVSDFPGQADLVRQNGIGLVVPADDAGALARAVRQLADDPAGTQAMGLKGRDVIASSHSWDARAEATCRVLDSLVASRRVAS
jgi:glycosyltransferase involved in cell wall biosynthesis